MTDSTIEKMRREAVSDLCVNPKSAYVLLLVDEVRRLQKQLQVRGPVILPPQEQQPTAGGAA